MAGATILVNIVSGSSEVQTEGFGAVRSEPFPIIFFQPERYKIKILVDEIENLTTFFMYFDVNNCFFFRTKQRPSGPGRGCRGRPSWPPTPSGCKT